MNQCMHLCLASHSSTQLHLSEQLLMMCLSIHFARDRFFQIKWHERTHVAVMIVRWLLWDIASKGLKKKQRDQVMIMSIIYLASVGKKHCNLV